MHKAKKYPPDSLGKFCRPAVVEMVFLRDASNDLGVLHGKNGLLQNGWNRKESFPGLVFSDHYHAAILLIIPAALVPG